MGQDQVFAEFHSSCNRSVDVIEAELCFSKVSGESSGNSVNILNVVNMRK